MSIAATLGRLDIDQDNEDARRVLKFEKALLNKPHDEALTLDKAIALVRLDRLQDARKFLASAKFSSADFSLRADAVKSYINYRLELNNDVKEYSMELDNSNKVAWPLAVLMTTKAQSLYRSGYLDEAVSYFQAAQIPSELSEDLKVNFGAIAALKGESSHSADDSQDAFDVCFNQALSFTKTRHFKEALELLSKAKRQAQDQEEVASSVLQAAYVELLSGNKSSATSIMESLHPDDLDSQLKLVLKLNQLVVSPPFSFADSLAATLALGTDNSSLIGCQRDVLEATRLNLRLGLRQGGPLKRHRPQLLKTKSKADVDKLARGLNTYIHPIAAYTLASASETENPERTLRNTLQKRPFDVTTVFALAQVLSDQGDIEKAAEVLVSFAATYLDLYKDSNGLLPPGLAGVIVAAHRLIGGLENEASSDGALSSIALVGEAIRPALALAQSSEAAASSRAATYFDAQPDAVVAAAGKLACGGAQDRYNELSANLTSVDELIKGVDVSDLLHNGVAPLLRRTLASKRSNVVGGIKKRKRRSRRSKLPASYDASKEPNPERWLALHDRSSYKPKKKRGQATQGAAEVSVPTSNVLTSSGPNVKQKKKRGKR